MAHHSTITFGRHYGRENLVEERDSKVFASFSEAETYIENSRYWCEPVLISDHQEMDQFLNAYWIADCATDGRLHYERMK